MEYRIVGKWKSLGGRKFGEFGELPAIRQTKTIILVATINNPLADLFIRQLFSANV